MTKISIELSNYAPADVIVDAYEGGVHLDATKVEKGYPTLTPNEARTVAAVLVAQADAAERGAQ